MVFRKRTMRRKRVFVGGSATTGRKARTIKRKTKSLSLDRKKTKRTSRKVKSLSGNRRKSSSGNKRKGSSGKKSAKTAFMSSSPGKKSAKTAFKPSMGDKNWQKFREKASNESIYKKFHRSIVDKIMIMRTEREFTRHMLKFRSELEKEHSKIWMAGNKLDPNALDSVEIEKHMYIQDLHNKLGDLLINMEKFKRMADDSGISFSSMVTHAPHILYNSTDKYINDLIKNIKEWEKMKFKKLKKESIRQARVVGTVNSGRRTGRRSGRRSGRSVASSIKTMLGWTSKR